MRSLLLVAAVAVLLSGCCCRGTRRLFRAAIEPVAEKSLTAVC